MKWVTIETVLEIHVKVIKSTGGSYGLSDKNALESALNSPLATFEGKELYPGIHNKVAVLLYKIVNNHSFIDGNKRTGFVTALTILASNGFKFICGQEAVVQFMLNVAQGKSDYEQICEWFKKHTMPQN